MDSCFLFLHLFLLSAMQCLERFIFAVDALNIIICFTPTSSLELKVVCEGWAAAAPLIICNWTFVSL